MSETPEKRCPLFQQSKHGQSVPWVALLWQCPPLQVHQSTLATAACAIHVSTVSVRACLFPSLCNSGLSFFWNPKVFIILGGIFTHFNKRLLTLIKFVKQDLVLVNKWMGGILPSNPIKIYFILQFPLKSISKHLERSVWAESPVTDVFLNFPIICIKKLAVLVAFLCSESRQSRSFHPLYSFAYLFLFFNIYIPFLRSGYWQLSP